GWLAPVHGWKVVCGASLPPLLGRRNSARVGVDADQRDAEVAQRATEPVELRLLDSLARDRSRMRAHGPAEDERDRRSNQRHRQEVRGEGGETEDSTERGDRGETGVTAEDANRRDDSERVEGDEQRRGRERQVGVRE